jgi:hypothetical protein
VITQSGREAEAKQTTVGTPLKGLADMFNTGTGYRMEQFFGASWGKSGGGLKIIGSMNS